jgi:hypothetical protein
MKRALLLMVALRSYGVGFETGPSCGQCHAREHRAHNQTSMSAALTRAADAGILRGNPNLAFRDGRYSYTIRRDGARSIYSVTDGAETISEPIAWAFGQGAAGQTYVFERSGKWYESRVSFYRDAGRLDFTLGALSSQPKDMVEAAGREMSAKDTAACFGCHSAGAVRGLQVNLDSIAPGVQCESCHEGATSHAAAVLAGDVAKASIAKLSTADTEQISELCGRCHRTWSDIATSGPRGVQNVRFQVYRLTNSKCYNVADRRISCVGCHDPHQELEGKSAAYDSKCAACHGATARACPTGKPDCAGCHMPKYEIPGSHHLFSDHQIRIVRANEKYPN